ncbi:Methyltransferase type 11 [Hymenobacter roseosalivarius DSM 11622]|uniref:Methyltransferase type 11 n=2 Tax=Hymenobacter roseosalivarius TaxID=89967 RepID=A0A1W1W4U2_9BACT|nr:Methyltransferase type 11 [Hymenobacter roseosalivarius DSM 11622]
MGIAHSKGQFLVFLDADDWLLPNALITNLHYLRQNPALAFVSGGYNDVFVAAGVVKQTIREIPANHYVRLLEENYISMLATVMWQRWVFDVFTFDPGLRGCEDYELYLRVARVYPVAHHTQLIATYRHHDANSSGNIPLMLSTALAVLDRQIPHLQSASEKQACVHGRVYWKKYYATALYRKLRASATPATQAEIATLLEHQPPLALRYFLEMRASMIKQLIKKYAPEFGLRLLHQTGIYKAYLPSVRQVALGDFARSRPFSTEFGYDRGGPIDRYYIENFLQREAGTIRGRVLEIGDNEYTVRFGQGVTQSDILHIDASNPRATFVGDLSDAPHIPDALFDCIILTQTLHLIYEYKQALTTCYRILKPGGVLLITVPGITPIDRGEWGKTWYWSFTDAALRRLLPESFPEETMVINSYGNVFAASAFLYGMGVSEVTPDQLDFYDSQFQVINTVKAVKPASIDKKTAS